MTECLTSMEVLQGIGMWMILAVLVSGVLFFAVGMYVGKNYE